MDYTKMTDIAKNLKFFRKQKGISQQKLADALMVARSTVAMWEIGKSEPASDTLMQIASIFNISTDSLLGKSKPSKNKVFSVDLASEFRPIPVIFKITDNLSSIDAYNIKSYESIHKNVAAKELIAMHATDESMAPRIQKGDLIIFSKQSFYHNGDISVFLTNTNEILIRIVTINSLGVILSPLSTAFEPSFFSNEQIENNFIKYIGKVIEIRSRIE